MAVFLFFFKEKEMPPACQPERSLEELKKGPKDREIWNPTPRGPLSHALTLGK